MLKKNWLSLGIMACCLTCSPAVAATVVTGEQLMVESSDSASLYSLDVYLDLTGGDDGGAIDLANLQVRARLKGPNAGTDVSVVAISESIASDHPQAFPLVGRDVVSDIEAFAFTLNLGNSFSVDDRDGLMSVLLEVQPNVIGDYELEFLQGDGNTVLIDGDDFTTPLAFTSLSGGLSISSVPERSGMVILSVLGVAMLVRRTRRQ